jgi:hypothetical protein
MPKGKARYSGSPTFWGIDGEPAPIVLEFSDELKTKLREFFEDSKARKRKYQEAPAKDYEELFGSSADRFVEEVLAETRFVFAEKQYLRASGNKQDTKAEQKNLATKIRSTINRIKKYPSLAKQKDCGELAYCLLRISPDLDRLLEAAADPRGCAEILERYWSGDASKDEAIGALNGLFRYVIAAGAALIPDKLREKELQHGIAVRLAAEILPVLERSLLSITSYASSAHGGLSDAVMILKAIGDEAGLFFEETVWRSVISESKQV